jgi:hypothetical protein
VCRYLQRGIGSIVRQNHSSFDYDLVLRFIDQLTDENDFVSFKLDIDTIYVEVPIFLELINNMTIAKRVDDFFFELHYADSTMGSCAWKQSTTENYGKLKLNVLKAMELFYK